MRLLPRAAALAVLLLGAACAPSATIRPEAPTELRLPPIPEVLGDLHIDVVYPPEGSFVATLDSTFIFGNVGRGDASLSINRAPVEVAPNGAWLAYLPVPPDGVYQLSATAGGRTATATRTIQVPSSEPPIPKGELRIIRGSVTPSGAISGVRGEQIEVSFRGTPDASARLVLGDGTVVPLVEQEAIDRLAGFMLDRVQVRNAVSEYVGLLTLNEQITPPDPNADTPALAPGVALLDQLTADADAGAYVELARGGESVRAPFPAAIGVLDPLEPRVAVAATDRPDSTVIARRYVGADQAWDFFWPNGTLLHVDGERDGFFRVRLAPDLSAWVAEGDVRLLPAGTPPPNGFVGPGIELVPRDEWVDVRFSVTERMPFRVEPGEWGLSISFYGATGRPAYVGYGADNDFVDLVDWDQPTDHVFRFNVHLNRPLWGFRTHWEGQRLVLQVRKPPVVDPGRPLAGLRIGVDAGHRGTAEDTGAIGPTRLNEVDATLAVIQHMIPMLEDAGATVVDIHTDTTIVPLIDRPIAADRNNVHLFFSVHFNAFPNGVNPFENHGTTSFYYWPQSLEFARDVEDELLGEFGLPNRGVRFQNLAITRTSWMPSILSETMYLMFPRQEAALRDPAVLDRIAAAHVRAMETFVRDRTSLSKPPEQ